MKTINNIKITEKEEQFFVAFLKSDFSELGINSNPWDYSVLVNLPYTNNMVRAGVVSMLMQKGLIIVNKKQLKTVGGWAGVYSLTETGKAVVTAMLPEGK